MLSFDKTKIKLKVFAKAMINQLIYWNISFNLFVFFTGNSALFINYLNFFDFGANLRQYESQYLNIFVLSVVITILFILIENFIFKLIAKVLPGGMLMMILMIRSVINFSLALLIILLAVNPYTEVFAVRDWNSFMALVPDWNIDLIRFLVFFFLAIHFQNLYAGMFKKIGRSNRSQWLFGGMDKPREENRIFMFIDMKDSTKKAEVMGHKKFSHLVMDVFNDMSVVDNYGGEIYQYLGDGAIVSWNLRQGLKNLNCIKAFYAVQRVAQSRSMQYKFKYGDVPQFKAGIHVGKTMVLQVGKVRRDISYNGDTLNTTARIESMCNVYRQSLMISGVLYEKLKDKDNFNFKEIEGGKVKLKGKKGTIQLYGVQPVGKKK